jgi:hypothetical protein
MRLSSLLLAATACVALAAPASSATLTTFIGPNSDSATQTCSGDVGPKTGATTVHAAASCFSAQVGTANGEAVAATGHVGALSQADSHNGDSLVAKIGSAASYEDFLTFTSSDPFATTTPVSVNLLLDGILETSGPFGAANFRLALFFAGHDFDERFAISSFGIGDVIHQFILEGGEIGPVTDAALGTPTFIIPLNSPLHFELLLETGAVASGPGSHGLAGFGAHSAKFASTPFDLPDGVTVNAGDYIVNNRFIDPLAPVDGVPEPTGWALTIAGFALAGSLLRQRRILITRLA